MSSSGSERGSLPVLGVAALVVAADQLTKLGALAALDDGPIDLVWTLRLKLHFNSGAAFSVAGGRGGLLSLVGLVAVAVLWRSAAQLPGRLGVSGLGLVLGGALGNLADRVFRAGEGFLGGRVIDFVDLQWWPVFNMADVAIVSGAGLFAIASLRAEPSAR